MFSHTIRRTLLATVAVAAAVSPGVCSAQTAPIPLDPAIQVAMLNHASPTAPRPDDRAGPRGIELDPAIGVAMALHEPTPPRPDDRPGPHGIG